jgi:hypothetical protein
VSVRSGGHDTAARKAISQQVREQERREMVQGEGLLESLRGLLARGEQRPSIVGKDIDVLVAPADLVGQHPHIRHQRQVGHVPVDPPAAAGRRGFLSDQADALGIAAHEGDLGSSPHELDRGGSPDSTSGPSEHDNGHRADLTLAAVRPKYRADTGAGSVSIKAQPCKSPGAQRVPAALDAGPIGRRWLPCSFAQGRGVPSAVRHTRGSRRGLGGGRRRCRFTPQAATAKS